MKTKQKYIDSKIKEFEETGRVQIDGLTYKRHINENSFYRVIEHLKLKLVGK